MLVMSFSVYLSKGNINIVSDLSKGNMNTISDFS